LRKATSWSLRLNTNHELTNLGKLELRDILRDPEMKREFLKMAMEEAKKNPKIAKQIILGAVNKLKEYRI
jgi:hypothetical protein